MDFDGIFDPLERPPHHREPPPALTLVVLKGLLSRPDWDAARRVPIAHVPGGSGNGLAHSCGLRDVPTAAFAICKAVVSPMDVASVLQPPASRQYIMLSVAYGSLANLDINTERFRWMGDLRFTLGAVWVSWLVVPLVQPAAVEGVCNAAELGGGDVTCRWQDQGV